LASLRQEVDSLSSLKESVIDLTNKVSVVLNQHNSTSVPVDTVIESLPDSLPENSAADNLNDGSAIVSATSVSRSFANLAANLSDSDFIEKKRKKRKPAPGQQKLVKLSGTCSSTSLGVTGVPRRLVAYLSRVHINTEEQDIIDMLRMAGVEGVQCFRIQPKEGKVYKTAAFRVSCDPRSATAFYDESNWPIGCELRDWIFYKK